MISGEPKEKSDLYQMIANMQKTIDELCLEVKDLKINFSPPNNRNGRSDKRDHHRSMQKTCKCYTCGVEGHISRNCPENDKRRKTPKAKASSSPRTRGAGTKAPGSIGVDKQPNEAGVFVEANIHCIKYKVETSGGYRCYC
jgi:hypothetical protein